MQIKEKHINQILNDKLSKEYWIFELGVGLQYEGAPPGIKYSAPYEKMGGKLWRSLEQEFQTLFCKRNKPKEWVNDLISGDIRNLIIGVVSAITAKYNVGLGIAIPATALVIKNGMIEFCKKKNLNRKLPTVKTILKKK